MTASRTPNLVGAEPANGPDRPSLARRAPALAAAAVAALVLAACTSTPAPGPTGTPTPEPTSPDGSGVDVVVYYVVDTRAGVRLAREAREAVGDEPLVAAVEEMIAGPDDPDYSTTWDSGTEVLGVTQEGGEITVDLSEEARTASVGSEGAAMMIQQLVYTVTEDDPDATVLLLIAGEPAGELWGAVTWDEPVGRDDPLDVRVLVQIDEPQEEAEVSSPVTVSGDAAVFEANLLWRVLDEAGEPVQTGNAMTAAGQEFAPFTFDVELEPGTYTIEISEGDASGGEAGTPMTDTKTVTVS